MKKFAIAAALLVISASAHAGTYSYEGVTINVQDGCRSSSCVSVNAPGYGSYNGAHAVKVPGQSAGSCFLDRAFGDRTGKVINRHSGARVSANPESRDSPMRNCASWVCALRRIPD
jgi:hypothetical protein